jgi:uncharacterized membrane protein HdeD (DUF308 family)
MSEAHATAGMHPAATPLDPERKGIMNSTTLGATLDALTERWWVPVIRGLVAIIFGVLALTAPSLGLLALVIMWGAYAITDGVFNLALATRASRAGDSWGWLVFEGIISIAAGVLTFVYPGMTAFALLYIIGAWAIVTGIAEIAAAVKLRRVMTGEWMLALTGVLSILFGVLCFAYPGSGALAVVWLIATYAIVFGVLLIGLGVKLHRVRRDGQRAFPTGGTPAAA